MGWLDRVRAGLLGRSRPAQADLDQLFAVPDAALTLESAAGFRPTGTGAVCFRAAEGGAASATVDDAVRLLDADGGVPVERSVDDHGFTWLLVRHDPGELPALVTELHAVNSSLEAQGFGPLLLCSTIGFRDAHGRRLGLVYLYKRGAFYPFAPLDGERRDTALELQVRALLAGDVRIEPDLGRWFPVWGAPGV